MLVSVSNQAYIFLYTVLGGMLVGLVYDMFRISRKTLKTKNIIVYFEDILFWLIISILIFAIFFISNAGEIRGYAVLGIILGIIIYAVLLSYYVIKICMSVINTVKKVCMVLFGVVWRPIRLLIDFFKIPIRYLIKCYRRLNKFIFSKLRLIGGLFKENLRKIKTFLKKF